MDDICWYGGTQVCLSSSCLKKKKAKIASAANRTRGPTMATMDFTTKPLTLGLVELVKAQPVIVLKISKWSEWLQKESMLRFMYLPIKQSKTREQQVNCNKDFEILGRIV